MKGKLKVEFEISKDYVVGTAVVTGTCTEEQATRLLKDMDAVTLDMDDSQKDIQVKIVLALIALGAAAEAKEI